MTSQTLSTDLDSLGRTLTQLTMALEKSERRSRRLEGILRWGALGLVAFFFFLVYVLTDSIGIAHAQKQQAQQGLQEAATVVEALNSISNNLALFGMLGGALQQAKPAIDQAIMDNPDVQKHVRNYLNAQGIPVTEENIKKYAPAAIMQGTVTTFVDTVVLLQRIREDSNAFRNLVGGPVPALEAIESELKKLNIALASVPVMAAQMDLMNRNMASMTYSMGSTMGRMGNWVPW